MFSKSISNLAFLVVLCLFATVSSALPTLRLSSTTGAAPFEPLFRPAAPQVGPARSLARLRRRRVDLASVTAGKDDGMVKRAFNMVIGNPKAKRSDVIAVRPTNPKLKQIKRSVVVSAPIANPKSKRALPPIVIVSNPKSKRSLPVPAVVENPKAKRQFSINYVPNPKASPAAVPTSAKARRNLLSFISGAVKRRRSVKLEQTTVVSNPKRRSLERRDLTSIIIGIVNIVPNPKSPNFQLVLNNPTTTASLSATSTSASTSLSSSTFTSSQTTQTSSATTTTQSPTTTARQQTTTTTATTTSSTPSATASSWPSGDMIAAAYYPDWDGDLIPPSSVDFSLFDLLDFAFAIPTASFGVEWEDSSSGPLLEELVKYAHGNNTKVLISVGGWTDSTYFSSAVATAASRKKFVTAITKMVALYDVDGIDIDWEYPGGGGADGNEASSSDTANFLLFLQALRASLGTDKRISACTTQTPFLGADGSPLTDVAAFGEVLDNILVMNYDVWGASSTPGPNAPLTNACSDSQQPNANEESAIEIWTAAGFPASKILMGVPSYGYISSSTATTLVHKRSLAQDAVRPRGLSNREHARHLHTESRKSEGRRWRDNGRARAAKRKADAEELARRSEEEELTKRGTIIVCPNNHSGQPCAGITNQTIKTIDWNPLNNTGSTNVTSPTNSTTGVFNGGGIGKLGNGNLASIDGNQIQFYQLISYGVIVQDDNSSNYTAVNGYVSKWDECSSTPYLYNTARKVVITYDDPTSLTLKGQLAKEKSIGGINMWDISGDTYDWQLVKAYRSGMGLST